MKLSNDAHAKAAQENDALAGRLQCHQCRATLSKAYCGHCDEFYNDGHAADCPNRLDRGVDHHQCRAPEPFRGHPPLLPLKGCP